MTTSKNKLSLLMLTALVTGNMVASGVFMLPASLAQVGSISLIAWVFTSVGALLLALVFAKMSQLFPKTGGPYAYAHMGFGNFIGFQTAYVYWIMVLFGNAAVAIAFVGYLRIFLPILANPYLSTLMAIAAIWVFTFVNTKGIRSAGMTQVVTTILKFIPLVLVAALGWFYFHPEYITQSFNVTHKSNFSAFSFAATLTLWNFLGLETATIPADSVDNPRRNIPLATVLGTSIAMIIYISSTAALMGMIAPKLLATSTSPFASAMGIIFGRWGEIVAALGAIISCLGGLNGWILIQGQMPMAAAEDKLFPKFFATRNKHDVPAQGIIASSMIVSLMLLVTTSPSLNDQFQLLIMSATVSCLLAYLYTAVAQIILLPEKEPDMCKNIINISIAFAAACYAFWATFGSGQETVFYMTILIFSSIPLYIGVKYHTRKTLLEINVTNRKSESEQLIES